VAFGGELSDAAFRFGTGSYTLAGIHLEEILGVGLQVLQMDAVIRCAASDSRFHAFRR
jgi:hypothetical protein